MRLLRAPARVVRRRPGLRPAVLLLVLVPVFLVGFASSASANPFTDMCNNEDPPIPARPGGDESWVMTNDVSAGDPFTDDGVTMSESYGTVPTWFVYDNGCGGRIMAGVGSAVGNNLMQFTGAMVNWAESLMGFVIQPSSWVGVLDAPMRAATRAVAQGVWSPWVPVVLLLVAGLVMLRARGGHLAGSITAAAWALIVLVFTTWLINYPAESTKVVDDTVRTAVVSVAQGFSESDAGAAGPDCSSPGVLSSTECGLDGQQAAMAAVGGQMDDVVRATQYRTWAAGVFGDADSATAREYGPNVYRATHFSHGEWATYQKDPTGDGKKILDRKQGDFEELAERIEKADPVAYESFKGNNWGSRLSLSFLNLLVVLTVATFLLVAGLAILLCFALIRVLVPFAPALGVIFLMENTRDMALSLMKKVAGPLVMGPVYFVAGLLLLRLDSAVLASGLPYIMKIVVIALVTWVAWMLCKPATYAPRVPGLRNLSHLGTYLAVRRATKESRDTPDASDTDPDGAPPQPERPSRAIPHQREPVVVVAEDRSTEPVYRPAAHTLPAGDTPHDEPARALPGRRQGDGRRPAAAAPAGVAFRRSDEVPAAPLDQDLTDEHNPAGHRPVDTGPDRPEDAPPAHAADGTTYRPVGSERGHDVPPDHRPVHEANLTADPETGEDVFVVYRPPEARPGAAADVGGPDRDSKVGPNAAGAGRR